MGTTPLPSEYSTNETPISQAALFEAAQKYFLKVRSVLKHYDGRGEEDSRNVELTNGPTGYFIEYKPQCIRIIKKEYEQPLEELTIDLMVLATPTDIQIAKKYHPKGYISYWNPSGRETVNVDARSEKTNTLHISDHPDKEVDTTKALHSAKTLIKEICLLVPGVTVEDLR